ncbi:9074_t:CDS:2 [Dentiscutata heterogama]|uniref:9074_t:CDS:1 n=1 Tax=Dentiscutata heterogama TaxID=1316150 RepID=A0ACA9KRI0_9GLOM|nr:9074_t:CDS:2 [Dentiscutata heterogama]
MPNIKIQSLSSNISADNFKINFMLKKAVRKEYKVPSPNIVILEAELAPSTNLVVHKAYKIYIEDLELNQEESLNIAYNEAIF